MDDCSGEKRWLCKQCQNEVVCARSVALAVDVGWPLALLLEVSLHMHCAVCGVPNTLLKLTRNIPE
jgi:hypothetical protein